MQGIFVVDVFLGIRGAPREDEHAKEAAEQTTSQGRTVQCWLAEKKPLPAAIPPVGEIHRSRSNLQEPGCLLRLDLWKITLQVHFYKVSKNMGTIMMICPSTPLNTGNPGPEVRFRGCNHYIVYGSRPKTHARLLVSE